MWASVLPLVVVLGMLAGLLWWARRLAGRAPGGGRHIQVIETVALGPGRSLHLVRLADRALLLACSAKGCELICELEQLPGEPPAAGNRWSEMLRARAGSP